MPDPELFDVALLGGQVIDPETRTDSVANIAISGRTIRAVTVETVIAKVTIDASGYHIAPGWIDLHSHAQSITGGRLQARDGVTTALELESGMSPVAHHYAKASEEGRPINYGYSTSWQQARMIELAGLPARADFSAVLADVGDRSWMRTPSSNESAAVLRRIENDLADGAIGVGLLVGYAPGVDPAEYVNVSLVAASAGVGTFTHARDLVEQTPGIPIDGATEIVQASLGTGVRAHYCHINSTSLWHVDRVHSLIEHSGAHVTTEAYPYGAGSTAIGADFLAPESLQRRGLHPESIVYTPTGERVTSLDRLKELRATDPGGVAIVHYLDEAVATDRAVIERSLTFPGAIVASDAMPVTWDKERLNPRAWPPPSNLRIHPRAAGTFSRFVSNSFRRTLNLDLIEAIERCTLGPARILEPFVPSMSRKGRIQVGCDADLVIFDASRISDQSTYEYGCRPSRGYRMVMVGGVPVVENDETVLDALPGRPIKAA